MSTNGGSAGLTFEAGSRCKALLLAVVRSGGTERRIEGARWGVRAEWSCGICLYHNVKNAAYRREMSEEKNWAPGFE